MSKLQIGAQMYSVRNHCQTAEDLRDTLKMLKIMGYNICQLSGYNRAIAPEVVRDILAETQMKCVCTHIGYNEMEEDLDKVIAMHKTIGCDYPGIGGLPMEYRNPEGFVEFAKKASKIADKLADNGLHFIYHNHAFEFEKLWPVGKNGLELLMENSSANFQFELDVFWVQMGGGNPLDWIEKVRGRMDICHFKEMNGCRENKGVMAPIGMGNMNWKAIMDKCDDIGVKYALIEQDNAVEQGSMDCMWISYKNLVKLGGRF